MKNANKRPTYIYINLTKIPLKAIYDKGRNGLRGEKPYIFITHYIYLHFLA